MERHPEKIVFYGYAGAILKKGLNHIKEDYHSNM